MPYDPYAGLLSIAAGMFLGYLLCESLLGKGPMVAFKVAMTLMVVLVTGVLASFFVTEMNSRDSQRAVMVLLQAIMVLLGGYYMCSAIWRKRV